MVYLDKPAIGSPKHAFREVDRLRLRGEDATILEEAGKWRVIVWPKDLVA